METFYLIVAVALAYACGSLSFAVLVSRVMRLPDPRTFGSGNPGATNVLRSGSKKAAVLTLLLDAFKGFLPVWVIKHTADMLGLGNAAVALVGLAAFAGHLWPVFFHFKGGKGVATAAGVLFGVHWILGLVTLCLWVIVAYVSRYSSLAAIVSAALAPLVYFLGDQAAWRITTPTMLALLVMVALLIYRHRDNIRRLQQGTEGRLEKRQAKKA